MKVLRSRQSRNRHGGGPPGINRGRAELVLDEVDERSDLRGHEPPVGIDDVHAAVAESGAITALEGASPAELAPFIAEIRHFWLLDHDYLTTPGRGSGWTYSDAADARQFGKTIVRTSLR